MHKLFQDSMAIVRFFGKPDLFITFTANPNWEEVAEGGQSGADRIDLITRIFNQKLDSLLQELKDGLFSPYKGLVRTIEFQKCGLPHCHILLFLDQDSKFNTPEKIDKVVCTKLPGPDQEPKLYAIIAKFMMHGPCGKLNPEAPCMKMDKHTGKMKCSKGFPKAFQSETEIHEDGYLLYQRRNDGRQAEKYVKG
jgi:Helitron helicase-like domain at N-terminus